jgi:serine/threonine protein kinase
VIGQRLSHYVILEKIGGGGQGDVYRARDERLPRNVAVKVLPPGTIADETARRRFRKEALALSRVNHPHIETVYEFDTQADVDFLVLELVAGVTLTERLRTGPIPEREVARLGAQLAGGLAAAHREGILHRDIKPGNLRLTPDGQLKVLDFGLAKLAQIGAEEKTESVTEAGRVAGTLPYMAPEQLRGERVDERMDVYAAGAVLYEMATGRRVFPQAQDAQLLAAILHEIPPAPSTMKRDVSPALDGIILKALDKDPERRYQSARELGVDLQRLITPSSGPRPAPAPLPARRWRRVAVGGLIALLAISGIVWGIRWLAGQRAEPSRELRQRQLTSDPVEDTINDAAISPDGRYLAYCNRRGIYVGLIDTGEPQALPLPPGFPPDVGDLAWFPDGTRILVSASEREGPTSIWAVTLIGGNSQRLRNDGGWASVSPDGARVVFLVGGGPERRGIWVMKANGEAPWRVLTTGNEEWFLSPSWSPDGRRVAYQRVRKKPQGYEVSIESVDLDGGRPVVITPGLDYPNEIYRHDFWWLRDGRVVFARPGLRHPLSLGGNLWEIRMHPRTGRPIGEPRRLTNWTGFQMTELSASADGKRLAYVKQTWQGDVYVGRLRYPGPRFETPQRLTMDDRNDVPASWTHDSKAVLFTSNRRGNADIFRQGLDQPRPEAIVLSAEDERWPCVSPDGAWILYETGQVPDDWSARRLMRIPIAGGPPESVFVASGEARYHCTLPPANRCVVGEILGQELVFSALDPVKGKGAELARVGVELPRYSWDLSPDGRLIALGDESGRLRIVDLDGGGVRQLSSPLVPVPCPMRWSANGTGLLVIGRSGGYGAILFVGLDGRTHRVWESRDPSAVFDHPCPSPDRRYLAFVSGAPEANAWMLEDF